jgi:hypothetical protein
MDNLPFLLLGAASLTLLAFCWEVMVLMGLLLLFLALSLFWPFLLLGGAALLTGLLWSTGKVAKMCSAMGLKSRE